MYGNITHMEMFRIDPAWSPESERFNSALEVSKKKLGDWSALTAILCIPFMFLGLLIFDFKPGWKPLLPVLCFWLLGLASAFRYAWRERWSYFPKVGQPLSRAFKEMLWIVWKWLWILVVVIVVTALFGGGIPGGG